MQPINMIMIYHWDKKLKKKITCPGSWYNSNQKKYWLVQRMPLLQDMFQMTTIVLVSVINHYHINGLHLFWDTLYVPAVTATQLQKYGWYHRSPNNSYKTIQLIIVMIERTASISSIFCSVNEGCSSLVTFFITGEEMDKPVQIKVWMSCADPHQFGLSWNLCIALDLGV